MRTSLWLVPEAGCVEEYELRIGQLAARLGTPSFAPHVTLLGGIEGASDGVVPVAERLAGELQPLALHFVGTGARQEYFRAFFLEAELTPELLEAHARAARLWGRDPDGDFFPHLSLVYGVLNEHAVGDLRREWRVARDACLAQRLDVVETQGPVETWRVVASFEMH